MKMNQDEDLIKLLVQDTGCDRKIAAMLLEFTGWDPGGAKRIIKAVPKDIFVLKAKFVTQVSGYYGAFFFCYDEKEGQIKRVINVISEEKDIGKIDITTDWSNFEKELYEYSKTRVIEGSKSEQLKKGLYEKKFVEKIANILKKGKTLKSETIHSLLVSELYNIFPDTNIAVKFNIEMTDVFELNKGEKRPETDGEKEGKSGVKESDSDIQKKQSFPGRSQSLIVLRVDPVLSAVRGTEIKYLEFGDEIQVRITDERDIADYLAELLGGKVDSIRVPVMTKIVEVEKLEDGGTGVLTQFGPGIMGMFKVLSDVKVLSSREPEEPETPSVPKIKELNPLIVVGGIVLVIILFILLMILSR